MKSNTTDKQSYEDNAEHVDLYLKPTTYYEIRNQVKKRDFFLRVSVLLIVLNLILIVNAFSQLLTFQNVSVSNTAQITAKGDVLFTAGSTLNNNGTLDLSGDFINNASSNLFGISGGTVILNGSNQTIGGAAITHFNNLELQGTGTKTLLQDALTGGNNGLNTGILSLNGVKLDLNSHELTVNNTSAGAVTRTTGFIVSETDAIAGYGTIRWLVKNNTGNYVFPFGNAVSNHYVPVRFEITTPGNGTNGLISVATYPTNTTAIPNNRPLPAGLNSLLSIAGTENAHNTVDRWWVMDVAGYTDKPVSSVTFTYRDSEWDASAGSTNTIIENLLQAQSNNGTVWDPFTLGTVNTTNNTVTVTGMNFYNPYWTLVGSNNPLPIQMLVFDARLNSKLEVDLNWITATEVGNDYFTVQRSRDGVSFESIGTVNGAGNSVSTTHYIYVDKNPYIGINYYRLKQTDFDGNTTHSDIKAIRIEKSVADGLSVYPNPVSTHFYVSINGETPAGSILISDMNGKIIREISMEQIDAAGSMNMMVMRNGLAPGVYMVTVPGKKSVKVVME